jgi:hypothetical protein
LHRPQRFGENALAVIRNVKDRLAEIAPSLPQGVTIEPVYDRSDYTVDWLALKGFIAHFPTIPRRRSPRLGKIPEAEGGMTRTCRDAAKALGTKSTRSIVRWYQELEHHGFLRGTAECLSENILNPLNLL